VSGNDEFRWLFAVEYPAVVRTVYLVLHDHARAEEIAQDAFVQLLGHWDKVSRYEAPDAWVRRVAIRLAVRDMRRERRRFVLTSRASVETPTYDTVMDVDLLAAIKSLPPQQRSVVVLFYYEDRPMDEIADILGCSTSTGWVHLHRARKRLGALLTEEVGNDVH
jgi:RNA polymerase sigma-70 factor (ECF subfamily)